MRRAVALGRAGCAAAALLLAACGAGPAPSTAGPEPSAASISAPTPSQTAPARDTDFDPANFTHPTDITNGFFPMVPGMRMHWTGHAYDEDDGKLVNRAIDFTVSDLTKVIDGVTTRVAWDRDYTDGEMEEVELTFYAQDDAGTVWYFGEYSEELDHGDIEESPLWLGGLRGARPGIMMQAAPAIGTPSYAEGWGPEVEWTDRGQVDQVGIDNRVAATTYYGVLVIDEFNPDEPGKHQLKYYAPGVGDIRTGWRGKNEQEKEELALSSHTVISVSELATVRRELLAQEKRANHRSPKVYGKTAAMVPR